MLLNKSVGYGGKVERVPLNDTYRKIDRAHWGPRSPRRPTPSAVVLVRGTASHDTRVLREAHVLESMGEEVVVLAVTSTHNTATTERVEGIRVVRLSPRSPLELFRKLGVRWAQAQSTPPEAIAQPAGSSDVPTEPIRPSAVPTEPPRFPVPETHPGLLASAALRSHRLLRTLDFYRRAVGAIRAWRPHLVHCNDYNTMWIGVAARLMGSRVIYDPHELWADRNQRLEPRWWLLLCEALFVRAANAVVTTSPGHSTVIARRYGVPEPTVVRNIPRGHAGAVVSAADVDPRLAIYIGAVTTNRGLEQCIMALQQARDARLRIVGPGRVEYRSALTSLVQSLGLAERVEILAPVPPDRVVQAAALGGVGLALIQPSCLSYAQCLPNKLFEYVSAGLPVVASDLPILGGFVHEHGIGTVVKPDDIDAIAGQLRALTDPRVQAGYRKAVKRLAVNLDWGLESIRLRGVYD